MKYTEKDWPPIRNLIVDVLTTASAKHNVHGFMEMDITLCKQIISDQQSKDRKAYSFLAYLIWCFAQSVDQNKEIQALKKGKKLIIFDDVDINFLIEKKYKDGIKVPLPYILRSANKKTFLQINNEIRNEQKSIFTENKILTDRLKIARYPKWIRKIIWAKIEKNPILRKKYRGTVGLTSLNNLALNHAFWTQPLTVFPCTISVGGVYNKAVLINDQIENRKMLCLTLTVDHDIIDGAPTARFGNYFCKLLESAEGLNFEK